MKTLKTFAILCLAALFCGACATDDNDATTDSGLVLSFSPSTIYDNGEVYAEVTLKYNGAIVNYSDYTLYDAVTDKPVALENNRFSSTKKGTYTFWAAYGTLQSNVAKVTVIATPPKAPEAPEDDDPANTNFKRRVLLTQFTGTACGHCPKMMNALYLVNQQIGDDIVLTAAHLFTEDDPMYLINAPSLDNSLGVNTYPDIVADLKKNTGDTYATSNYVTSLVNNAFSRVDVKGGIAANVEYHEDKGFITATLLIKAKETAEFRVAAWLLEDNIAAGQANSGYTPVDGVNFGIHNNVVRKIEGKQSNMDYTGLSLGEIKAGETKTQEFAFELLDDYNRDNLRVVFFISTKEGNNWYVNNARATAKSGEFGFEYLD